MLTLRFPRGTYVASFSCSVLAEKVTSLPSGSKPLSGINNGEPDNSVTSSIARILGALLSGSDTSTWKLRICWLPFPSKTATETVAVP